MPPGAFRLALAYAVFVSHTLPLKLGLAAVFLFFALSGFWIFQMWTERYAFTQAPYRTFIVSRFWRLIPGFYLQLVILIAILLLFPPDLYRSPVFPFGRLELPTSLPVSRSTCWSRISLCSVMRTSKRRSGSWGLLGRSTSSCSSILSRRC